MMNWLKKAAPTPFEEHQDEPVSEKPEHPVSEKPRRKFQKLPELPNVYPGDPGYMESGISDGSAYHDNGYDWVYEASNFQTLLERLGGADGRDVIVSHHTILVSKYAKDKIEILKDTLEELKQYPVLDDDLASDMKFEQMQEDWESSVKGDALSILEDRAEEEEFPDDIYAQILKIPELENMLFYAYVEAESYRGEFYVSDYAELLKFVKDSSNGETAAEIKAIMEGRPYVPQHVDQLQLPVEETNTENQNELG